MNKYRVTLTAEERTELKRLVSVGKGIGHKLSFFRPCQALQLEWSAAVRYGSFDVQQQP
jgi:hypothetical protein